jgi:hypothetical protein
MTGLFDAMIALQREQLKMADRMMAVSRDMLAMQERQAEAAKAANKAMQGWLGMWGIK